MLSVEQAQERILKAIDRLAPKHYPLLDARGLVLAEDAVAQDPIPTFASSAMDGYAVRSADAGRASEEEPARLRVAGESAAGTMDVPPVCPGEAVRIFTGAPVPEGADAVVMQEVTRRDGNWVEVLEPVKPGRHIRPVGNDVAAGVTVLPAGTVLTPAALGMLASMGRHTAFAVRRPRVAILSTGDELAMPGEPLQPGRIYDSNRVALAALCAEAGAVVDASMHVPDREEAIRAALDSFARFDVILTSGGVSVGDHDLVKDILSEGGAVDFWKVAIKPGKPLAFGRYAGVPFFGLPGNSVSAYVTFEVFVRPALRAMMGHASLFRPEVTAVLEEAVTRTPGRREYMRARLSVADGTWRVRVAGEQDSAVMSALARANALLIVPEEAERLEAGQTVRAMWLDH